MQKSKKPCKIPQNIKPSSNDTCSLNSKGNHASAEVRNEEMIASTIGPYSTSVVNDISLWPDCLPKNMTEFWVKKVCAELQHCDEELLKLKSVQKNSMVMFANVMSACLNEDLIIEKL